MAIINRDIVFFFSAVAHALQVGKDQTSAFQCGTGNCCVLFDRGDPNAGGQWRDTVICGRMIGRFVLVLVAACAAFAASDPSVNGPFASSRQTVDIPGTQNATLVTDIYFPGITATGVDPAAVPCPVIVLGHGFAQSRNQHVNQAMQLATRGYIVLIPSFNGGSDHARNGQDLSKCIDWILGQNEDPTSIFFGRVHTRPWGPPDTPRAD